MSRLLAWREAGHEDRASLQGFTCTIPAQPVFGQKRKYHPKPWEQEVQSGIRALRPPVGQDQCLLVGGDAQGIAAVCLLADQGEASVFKIQAVAVATRHRGQGGAHADEALDVTFETAAQRGLDSGRSEIIMVSWVDPKNESSKSLHQRAGFALRQITQTGLEEWAVVLELTQAFKARAVDTRHGLPG